MTTYTKRWFAGQVTTAISSADTVVPLIIDLVHPKSVVDLGCGLGAWLAAFVKNGVTDIQGVDGDYVERSMLKIPAANFRPHDFTQPLTLPRRFDLAMSLEVGEHLPESVADLFVHALTSLAPIVVFSAALPGQGGNRHINEQWQSYWVAKFASRGYSVADPFRPALWTNGAVEWWYRQNMLLYVSAEALAADASGRLRTLVDQAHGRPMDLVHPEMFEMARDLAAKPARTLVRKQVVTLKQTIKRIMPG